MFKQNGKANLLCYCQIYIYLPENYNHQVSDFEHWQTAVFKNMDKYYTKKYIDKSHVSFQDQVLIIQCNI